MTTSPVGPATARAGYHHGNLAAALVEAGLRLTRTGGPAALSLRDVTRAVGVSPNALYRHFTDRDALLRDVSERIQQDLADRMRPPATDAGPRGQLRAVGLGYVAFALAEPGWFDVAFGDLEPRALEPSTELPHLPAPLARLVEALDALVECGELAPAQRPGAEWPCWSAVHGFALLALHGPLRRLPAGVLTPIAERTVDALITGLLDPSASGQPSASTNPSVAPSASQTDSSVG